MRHLLVLFLSVVLCYPMAGAHHTGKSKAKSSGQERVKACKEALDKAKEEIKSVREGASTAPPQTQAQNQQNQQQGQQNQQQTQTASQSPIQQMIQAQQQAQQAELQAEEQKEQAIAQIDDTRFQEKDKIEDKLHELNKTFYERKRKIVQAEFEARKARRQIESACEKEADSEYAKLRAGENAKSATGTLVTNSIRSMRGSRRRLRSQRRIYYTRCMSRISTKNSLKDIQDQLDTQKNLLVQAAEQVNSDVEHQKNKLPKLMKHLDHKEQRIVKMAEKRAAAAKEQAMMGMMGALMSTASSPNSAAQKEQKDFGDFASADDVIFRFQKIQDRCEIKKDRTMASNEPPILIPNDFVRYFGDVRSLCESECVDTNLQQSEDFFKSQSRSQQR